MIYNVNVTKSRMLTKMGTIIMVGSPISDREVVPPTNIEIIINNQIIDFDTIKENQSRKLGSELKGSIRAYNK